MKTVINTLRTLAILCLIVLGTSSCNNGSGYRVVEQPVTDSIQQDSVWMTVNIGAFEHTDFHQTNLMGNVAQTNAVGLKGNNKVDSTDLKEALDYFFEGAPSVIDPFHLELVLIPVSDLGLSGKAVTLERVWFAAQQAGLDICPPEVALHLVLQEPLSTLQKHYDINMITTPYQTSHYGLVRGFSMIPFVNGDRKCRWLLPFREKELELYGGNDMFVFVKSARQR